MRVDKYLQVSRLVKRRAIAKEIVEKGRVKVNDKVAKPGTAVKIDDLLDIRFGLNLITIKVLSINEKTKKDDAASMYEIISNNKEQE
ncbi:MAG: RNA-binding S4 domain-containing protein [Bacilli bacterium]